jgi:BON domain
MGYRAEISGIEASEAWRSCTHESRGERIMAKRHRILSFLVCIMLVTAFLGCASTQTRESSGQYLDDSAITTRVKAAIFDDPSLKVLQINVETFRGEVQLSGFVDSAQSVRRAGEVARGVQGVKSVKNDLIVK